jgi:hypothetical protein
MYPNEEVWEAIDDAIEQHLPLPWRETKLHLDPQDTSRPGWAAIQQLIEDATRDGREVFAPRKELGEDLWSQLVTLPESISTLKRVRKLHLYGSHLLRIPPEIGQMDRLEEFVPYTSYGLHWLPGVTTRRKGARTRILDFMEQSRRRPRDTRTGGSSCVLCGAASLPSTCCRRTSSALFRSSCWPSQCARYRFHFDGGWRRTYVICAVVGLYFNSFVGVVHSFLKVPVLRALAPKQTEPPFALAQGLMLVLFVVLGSLATFRFGRQRAEASGVAATR